MMSSLSAFVVRARRVEAHSLVSDRETLLRLARREMRLEREGNAFFLSEELPPEEQLESLAARVRPLVLQSESTHWAKALKALGFVVRTDVKLSAAVKHLKNAWKDTAEGRDSSGVYVQMVDAKGNPSRQTSDRELAYAYIYGDVVHHDSDRLAAVADFDVDNRYRSAAPFVAHLALLTLGTLNVARAAQNAKLLDLPPPVWDAPAVASTTHFRQEAAQVMVAPVGTPPPDNSTGFDSEWTDLRSAMRPSCPQCKGILEAWEGRGMCLSCRVSWGTSAAPVA